VTGPALTVASKSRAERLADANNTSSVRET
jgi:hypothetical protein